MDLPDGETAGLTLEEEHHEWSWRIWRKIARIDASRITRRDLECAEFRAVIDSLLLKSGDKNITKVRSRTQREQVADLCFRKADMNADNSLSFDEFSCFTFALRLGRVDIPMLVFSLFDLNCDGRIDEEEFLEMFMFFLGRRPTSVDFQTEWRKLDRDFKGYAKMKDFFRWLQSSTHPVFGGVSINVSPSGSKEATSASPQRERPTEESHLCTARVQKPKWAGIAPSGPKGAGFARWLDSKPRPGKTTCESFNPIKASSSSRGRRLDNAVIAKWNPKFGGKLTGNSELPPCRRTYLSRPQSFPELALHYERHKGFDIQYQKLMAPKSPKPLRVLTTDTGNSYAFNPSLDKPGGTMRSRDGKVTAWVDHWQTPLVVAKSVRNRLKPATVFLRCPGQPPDWMFAGPGETL